MKYTLMILPPVKLLLTEIIPSANSSAYIHPIKVLVIHLEISSSRMQQKSIANLAKDVEFHEIDESDVGELLEPHAKLLIQEDLTAGPGNK